MLTKIWSRLLYFSPNPLYEKGSEYETYNLTSIFKVAATKQRFDSFIQPYDLSKVRSTGITAGFLYTIFVILDFFVNPGAFTQIAIIRLLIVGPCHRFSAIRAFCHRNVDRCTPLLRIGYDDNTPYLGK